LDKKEIVAKTAKTDYPVSELISKRWSARAFSTRLVEKLKLLSILEAARWAPSLRNEQPWRYIVFTNDNPEILKRAQSVLKKVKQVSGIRSLRVEWFCYSLLFRFIFL
jgi:Nitroreductase family